MIFKNDELLVDHGDTALFGLFDRFCTVASSVVIREEEDPEGRIHVRSQEGQPLEDLGPIEQYVVAIHEILLTCSLVTYVRTARSESRNEASFG